MPGRWHPAANSYRDQQLQLLDQRLQAAFALAADAGELDEPLQPPMLTALLLGPLIFGATLQDGTGGRSEHRAVAHGLGGGQIERRTISVD